MLQPNANVTFIYGAETTFGEESAAAGKELRRVGSSLNLAKDSFASNEVRRDMQIASARHGGQRVNGAIEGELSTQSYDDFIEAALRGVWTAGVTATEADFTSLSASGSVFTAGSGSFIAKGFKVGDMVSPSELTGGGAANNGKRFRITGLTATAMTVYPQPSAFTAQTDFTLAVVGKKLLIGAERRSFTIEERHDAIDFSRLFLGCRVGGMSVRIPPNGMATASFEFLGQRGEHLEGGDTPFFASPAAALVTDVLTGIEGGVQAGGSLQAIITGLDYNLSNNLTAAPVIGTPYAPDIFEGRIVLTGQVSYYLQDATLVNAFLNEQEIDITAVTQEAGATPAFMVHNMQRVKLMGATINPGPDGGVIVQSPFQGLLKAGGSGTAYDQSSLIIQRSNA